VYSHARDVKNKAIILADFYGISLNSLILTIKKTCALTLMHIPVAKSVHALALRKEVFVVHSA